MIFRFNDEVTITVNEQGYFDADVGTAHIREHSLKAARECIEKELSAQASRLSISLPVCCLVNGCVERRTLTGVNRTTRALTVSPSSKGDDLKMVLPETPENFALLNDYVGALARYSQLRLNVESAELGKIGYGRVGPGEYAKLLDKIQINHATALASQETL